MPRSGRTAPMGAGGGRNKSKDTALHPQLDLPAGPTQEPASGLDRLSGQQSGPSAAPTPPPACTGWAGATLTATGGRASVHFSTGHRASLGQVPRTLSKPSPACPENLGQIGRGRGPSRAVVTTLTPRRRRPTSLGGQMGQRCLWRVVLAPLCPPWVPHTGMARQPRFR